MSLRDWLASRWQARPKAEKLRIDRDWDKALQKAVKKKRPK